MGDKSARLNRRGREVGRLRVSGTAGSRQGGGGTDGRGPDIAWLWGKKEKEERVEGGREGGREGDGCA